MLDSNKLIALILMMLLLTLTACNISMDNNSDTKDNITYDKNNFEKELTTLIASGNSDSYKDIDISFNEYDTCDINSYNIYYFKSSIYVQVNEYMYRFQLDENNVVTSYIKYGLEG